MIVRTDIVGWFSGQGNHSDIFTAQPCRMRNPTEICARSFSFHFKQSNNRNCNRSCVTHINWKWKKDCEEMPHIDPGSYFGNHVGRIDGMGQGSGMLTWQKKLSQCMCFIFELPSLITRGILLGPKCWSESSFCICNLIAKKGSEVIRKASPSPRKKNFLWHCPSCGGTSPSKLILTLLIFGAKRKIKSCPRCPKVQEIITNILVKILTLDLVELLMFVWDFEVNA